LQEFFEFVENYSRDTKTLQKEAGLEEMVNTWINNTKPNIY
jgi:hypothetical protein